MLINNYRQERKEKFMKLENLVFQKKSARGRGNAGRTYSYPNVCCSCVASGHGTKKTVFRFRSCDTLYDSNNYCVYALAGNRMYFMFCGESDSAYKLTVPTNTEQCKNKLRVLTVQYNKETSKFIRNEEYTPKLDNECGLWYIEY